MRNLALKKLTLYMVTAVGIRVKLRGGISREVISSYNTVLPLCEAKNKGFT